MTASREQWQRLFPLLDAALELPAGQHEAWLAALADADRDLEPLLRRMLASHAAPAHAGFLRSLPQFTLAETDDPSQPAAGDVVGPYRLEREIGRGGMARVWLARRIDGAFERDVALKLPYLTWDDTLALRMRRERSILATLEHPNIARLYDAGLDSQGRPYIAMEFVEGEPLDAYCRRNALPLRARLGLLLQVARAVAHAHARFVVHRDLKPGNVLVTREGSVRLLDFGVAKLLPDATQPDHTEFAARALTRDYAAPEQITGSPVTAATDVYALGVLAFELLSGEKPYRLAGTSLRELEDAIARTEPVLASTVARTRADRRALHGDLDAILLKALRKSPAERYATAEAFAADIERHLEGEPVHAQRRTRLYWLAKFAQRHRTAVAATALVVITLLITTTVAVRQARVAAEERNNAVSLLRRNEAVVQFVDQMLTEIASPDRPVTIDTLLERSESLVLANGGRDPEHQAAILLMLARYYAVFDNHRKASQLIGAASALTSARSEPGLRARIECERILIDQPEDVAAAERRIRSLIDGGLPDDASAACLRVIARVAAAHGDARRILPTIERARAFLARAPHADPLLAPMLFVEEGVARRLNGEFALSGRAFARALREYERLGRTEHPTVIAAFSEWANTLNASGDFHGAVQKFEQAVEISRRHAMGGEPPTNLMFNYAHMLRQAGRYAEALSIYESQLPRARESASPRAFINGMLGEARLYVDLGRLDDATRLLDEVAAPLSTGTLRRSQEGIAALGIRGRIAASRGDWKASADAFTQVLELYRERRIRFGNVVISLCERGHAYLRLGDVEKARADADEAERLAMQLSEGDRRSALPGYSAALLAQVQHARGDRAAESTAARALEILGTALGPAHRDTQHARRLIEAARIR